MAIGTGALRPQSVMSVFNSVCDGDMPSGIQNFADVTGEPGVGGAPAGDGSGEWAAHADEMFAQGASTRDVREAIMDTYGVSYEEADDFLADMYPEYAKQEWGIGA